MKIKSIFLKYKSLSAPVKASLWFVICNVLQKGISVLSTPIFTRLLTQSQYGTYSIYQSIYSIVSVLATLNLAAGVYNNTLTNNPEEKEAITSSFLGLSTTITICLFVVYFCFKGFCNNLLNMSTVLMLAMFAELLAVPAYSFWSAQERYFYCYRKVIAASLFIGVFGPVIAVCSVLISDHKAEAMIISFALIQIIVGLIIYIFLMKKGKTFFIRDYWKYALKFNLPLIPHYLSQTILNQADRIMIGRMVGEDKAAIYSVAYTISVVLTLVISAVNSSFTPFIYQSMKKSELSKLKNRASFLVFFVFLSCIVVIMCGPELIRILASSEYYNARWIVPPVAASLLFTFIAGLYGTIEYYYERTFYVMIASLVAAVANVVLNYFAIKKFGYLAAGYNTLICYILMTVIIYILYKWLIFQKNIHKIFDDRISLICGCCMLLFVIFALLIYDNFVVRYVVIVLVAMALIINRTKIFKALLQNGENE